MKSNGEIRARAQWTIGEVFLMVYILMLLVTLIPSVLIPSFHCLADRIY